MVELPLTITIEGNPYVKKNTQKTGYNYRLGRTVKYNTASYNSWHASALEQLEELGYDPHHEKENKERRKYKLPLKPALIDFKVNLGVQFYRSTNGRVDLSALYEGIQDTLVEVGILTDDNFNYVASHDGSGVQKDANRPRIELTITAKETAA